MKKLILILLAVAMTSCTCVMSQTIPAQFIDMTEGCGAVMPNYLDKFIYNDECGIDTVWQSPTYGTWITAPTTNAMIRAIDNSGNYTDLLFTITLVDTKGPEILLADSTLITDNYEKINTLYNMADRILAYQEMWFDANFDWAAAGIPDSLQPTNEYFNKVLLTWTSPGLGFGLPGNRVHTFVNPGDTLIIPIGY